MVEFNFNLIYSESGTNLRDLIGHGEEYNVVD
jgi:hypothetical protein